MTKTEAPEKSTVEEIRSRFDHDVERFSNLETGQVTTLDSTLCMNLIADAVHYTSPDAKDLLDIGCGAGNYTISILNKVPNLNCTLVDLSMPMLERAKERVSALTAGSVEVIQSDVRLLELPSSRFDVVVAASVLHHLRGEEEWAEVFSNIYRSLKLGGSFWIFDLVVHDFPAVDELMSARYAEYLVGLGGKEYQEHVFAYIAKEDTPRSVGFQMELMRKTGFRNMEVLHKNLNFAAFGGSK
ncbi:class I SAM-dependent methyltransferase [Arcticibacter sp. MXS-1]|uniref:class I SAM-dependent methyltransferase n=1 Tax=Arcticibacter sp. MXS-1 TaxID=3341726 RepID=UPI0035A9596E